MDFNNYTNFGDRFLRNILMMGQCCTWNTWNRNDVFVSKRESRYQEPRRWVRFEEEWRRRRRRFVRSSPSRHFTRQPSFWYPGIQLHLKTATLGPILTQPSVCQILLKNRTTGPYYNDEKYNIVHNELENKHRFALYIHKLTG